MSQPVVISVLGGFSVVVDGVARGPAIARRLAAILGALALGGERGIARERLLALLWPDADADRGRHALTQSLYALRRLLGVDDAILGTAHLALNPERVATDVGALERAMQGGDLEMVLRLAAGDVLEGFLVGGAPEFDRWLDEQRAATRQRVAGFLDAHARARLEAGDAAAAVSALRRRVALDPLDATAALELMRALDRAGDTPGAVQHARVYAQLVRQELDLEPDPRVAGLAASLQEAPAPVPDPAPTPVALARTAPAAVREPLGTRVRRRAARAATWWQARSRRLRLLARQGAVTAVAVATALLAIARLGEVRRTRALPTTGVAVLPFRGDGLAPDLAFLPVGIVDLLAPALAERDTTPVVEPARVLRWRRALPDVPADSLPLRAAALGTRRLVTGTLVGNAAQLVIRATLVETRGRAVLATATASGPLEDLPRLTARVATLLVAGAAGVQPAVAPSADADPRALRAFLEAQAAYRAGNLRQARRGYAAALATDSSLGAAAVGLALAADWLAEPRTRDRALELAARSPDRLSLTDRLRVVALRGPRWPDPTPADEAFDAWEQVALASEDPVAWVDLARRLLADARLAGLADAELRAREAFARARALETAAATPAVRAARAREGPTVAW